MIFGWLLVIGGILLAFYTGGAGLVLSAVGLVWVLTQPRLDRAHAAADEAGVGDAVRRSLFPAACLTYVAVAVLAVLLVLLATGHG